LRGDSIGFRIFNESTQSVTGRLIRKLSVVATILTPEVAANLFAHHLQVITPD